MYEAFFGFRQRPFPAVPNVNFYFAGELFEQAKMNTLRAVERAEGVALIVGRAGSGKSLLCCLVAESFRQHFQIATLSSARLCSRRALLQNILFELKLPYRDMEEGELRLSLIDHLEPSDRCPNGMLLIVDEAHTLPLRLLEEIRMITNLVRGGEPRVRLVLAGDPQLEERLATPRLASFQQRVAVRNYLNNLSQAETARYVRHQLQLVATRKAEVFDDGALTALYNATDGVPRLINQVCDHALVLACAGGQRQINARGIEEAWADLQQLPAPLTKSNHEGARPTVIEFGPLEDAPRSGQWQDFEEQFTGPDELPATPTLVAYDGEEEASDFEDVAVSVYELPRNQPKVVPPAADPFGGKFADEEVVLDRYAAWDNELRRRPRVRSNDGAQIAAALRTITPLNDEPVETTLAASVKEIRDTAQQVIASTESNDSTLGDRLVVTPQIVGGFGPWDQQWWTAQVATPAANEDWLSDDRDMLIVEDGLLPTSAPEGGPRVMRQEFRQLFGQLRGEV